MSDKKTQVGCCLITRGTNEINAEATCDLQVPDPAPEDGIKVIQEAITNDGDKRNNS